MGEPRSTLDVDLMIDADVEKVRALVRDLATSCYVDEGGSRGARNIVQCNSLRQLDEDRLFHRRAD